MSKVDSRIITFATTMLWLGLLAMNATSVFANEGRSHRASQGPERHHAQYERLAPGYAGPVPSVIQDCDLPSSVCSNDERISN